MDIKVTRLTNTLQGVWKDRPDSVCCNLEQMAVLLRMSGRTLQRRLKEENTCYLSLQEGARLELTLRLLSEGKSVHQVSEILGFANRRCFTRAFKRWTGASPSKYKHQPDR